MVHAISTVVSLSKEAVAKSDRAGPSSRILRSFAAISVRNAVSIHMMVTVRQRWTTSPVVQRDKGFSIYSWEHVSGVAE